MARCYEIFRDAYQQVSGLARTVRGPSMSAFPGKVRVVGISEIHGEKVFVLELIQAREGRHGDRPFFARFDPAASWFDQLRPAFGEPRFFFEPEETRVNGYNGIKRPPQMAGYTNGRGISAAGD